METIHDPSYRPIRPLTYARQADRAACKQTRFVVRDGAVAHYNNECGNDTDECCKPTLSSHAACSNFKVRGLPARIPGGFRARSAHAIVVNDAAESCRGDLTAREAESTEMIALTINDSELAGWHACSEKASDKLNRSEGPSLGTGSPWTEP